MKGGFRKRPALTRTEICICLAVLACAVCGAWFDGAFDRGPEYESLSASEWLDQASREGSPGPATVAFKAMGEPGAIFLASHLTDRQVSQAKQLYDFEQKHSWPTWTQRFVPWPKDGRENGDYRRCVTAAEVLSSLGTDAAPAFPIVWRKFQRDDAFDAQPAITATLLALGTKLETVIPELRTDLGETNRDNRVDCMTLLASLGPKAKPAIPNLQKAAKENGEVGISAAIALWKIDRATNVIIDVFSNNLQHGNRLAKWQTLGALKKVPEVAGLLIPPIEHVLADPNTTIAMKAANQLMAVEPDRWRAMAQKCWTDPEPVVQRLIEKVKHSSPAEQLLAIQKIGLLGPKAKAAVPALVEILQAWIPSRRQQLNAFGPSPESVAMAAVDALAEIGPGASPATEKLAELLRRDREDWHHYCRALGEIGPAAASAIPVLRELLTEAKSPTHLEPSRYSRGGGLRFRRSVDYAECIEISGALCRIDPQSAEAITTLKECYATNFPAYFPNEWKFRATVSLWKLGLITNPPSVESPKNDYIEAKTIELYGDMGPMAKSAGPWLAQRCRPDLGHGSAPSLSLVIALRKIDPNEADRLLLPGILLLSECITN